MGLTGFDLVFIDFICYYSVLLGFYYIFHACYMDMLGITVFYWVFLVFLDFHGF